MVSALRGQRPRPLDECASKHSTKIKTGTKKALLEEIYEGSPFVAQIDIITADVRKGKLSLKILLTKSCRMVKLCITFK